MLAVGVFGYPTDFILLCAIYASIIVHTWCFFRFFPKKRYPKLGLVLGNGLVLGCLLGLAGLLGESYLRFVSIETDAFGMSLPARRWFAVHAKLNSLGCRDSEWIYEKPAGVRRIAFVGDSFCYGWGIEETQDRYTDLLRRRFGERQIGAVEIMNVAKPGWGSGDQLQPVRDMIEHFAVDEVVLCYVANDIEKALPTTDDFDPTKPPDPAWFNPEFSCLVDYLYRSVYVPRVDTVSGYHDWLAKGFSGDDTWQAHQQELGAIIQSCREAGVPVRAILQPFLWTGGDRFNQQQIHAQVRAFLETNGVEVLDLLPVIEGLESRDLMVNRHDPHPNGKAHALFAEAIWDAFYATSEDP